MLTNRNKFLLKNRKTHFITTNFPGIGEIILNCDAGWNAGRGLVISQVDTEYFVWCDDDFVFTDKTNLQSFLNIIETSGFDVIGGGVGMNHLNAWRSYAKLGIVPGTFNDGICIKRAKGYYGQLPGFPNCIAVDLIANFYIARTDTAGQEMLLKSH